MMENVYYQKLCMDLKIHVVVPPLKVLSNLKCRHRWNYLHIDRYKYRFRHLNADIYTYISNAFLHQAYELGPVMAIFVRDPMMFVFCHKPSSYCIMLIFVANGTLPM